MITHPRPCLVVGTCRGFCRMSMLAAEYPNLKGTRSRHATLLLMLVELKLFAQVLLFRAARWKYGLSRPTADLFHFGEHGVPIPPSSARIAFALKRGLPSLPRMTASNTS